MDAVFRPAAGADCLICSGLSPKTFCLQKDLKMKWYVQFLFLLLSTSALFAGDTKTNWRKQFMWGMFGVPKTDIVHVKNLGFEYVHNYGTFEGAKNVAKLSPLENKISYLDEAHKHGLKVMTGISRYQIKNGQFDEIRKFIEAVKDHPAIGAWYLYDEPCLHTDVPRQNLAKTYRILKAITPAVPVICSEGWGKNWHATVEFCDVLLPDFYPVRCHPYPVANMALAYRFYGQANKLGKPVVVAMQSYNADAKYYHKDDPERKKHARFPSPMEQRFTFYTSLVQGAKGMMWFSYSQARKGDSQFLRRDLKPILNEMKLFLDLVKPAENKVIQITKYNTENDLCIGYWKTATDDWVVICNVWAQPKDSVNVNLAPHIARAKLHPWGGTQGGVKWVDKGRVQLKARPWESFVYRVERIKK